MHVNLTTIDKLIVYNNIDVIILTENVLKVKTVITIKAIHQIYLRVNSFSTSMTIISLLRILAVSILNYSNAKV